MAINHLIDILQPLPGIQRDGTQFDTKNHIDGQHCRWYRGRAKKIGGYSLLLPGINEIIRNLHEVNKQNAVDIYIGRPSSLNVSTTTITGISGPENNRTPANFMANPDNIWTFDDYTTVSSLTITLANNPISTVSGANVVTVTVPDTSIFSKIQTLTIANATTTGGLTTPQLNIIAEITVTSGTTFTYVVSGSPATTTVTGGGNAITLTYQSGVTYIIAHAAPNASDINNNIQTNIYFGDVNSNTPLTLIDPVNLPLSSSGFLIVFPYMFIYGNDGSVSYTLTPTDWSTATTVAIAGTKIIKGIVTRGGSTTGILFFSMNSVIRATFQGGNPAYSFNTVEMKTSILSQNCIISIFNNVYWVGVNQFYSYNGVVRPLLNDMNTDYFFENLNYAYRNKVFSWYNARHHEWWIHWPKGNATECTDVLIYNVLEQTWYDTQLARSAVYEASFFSKPILADTNQILNKFNPIIPVTLPVPVNGLATINGSSTVTVTLGEVTNLQSGNILTLSGATMTGGIPAVNLNITAPIVVTSLSNQPTVFTYTATASATSTVTTGGGTAIFYTQNVPNDCYGIWEHETGLNMVLYGQSYAIQSFYETHLKTLFDQDPSQDRNLRIRRIEPDFNQQGEMNLIIKYRSFAQSTIYESDPYVFLPGQESVELAKVDTVQMGRLVSFRFESNIVDGYFYAGKILLNYAPGDFRP
jgi:hypothetical protein